jgi:predicted porin
MNMSLPRINSLHNLPHNKLIITLISLFALTSPPLLAGDDMQALLEILLEKGIITQQEFDNKLEKAKTLEAGKARAQAQETKAPARITEASGQSVPKFKTELYGQVSSGYYSASNMTATAENASGISDQPKVNNRIGLRATRELDADVSAVLTLESNFSSRTGALGKDAGGYGVSSGPVFDREANFRLKSQTYGTIIVGRGATLQNELSGAFDPRSNWNFGGLKPIARYAGFHSAAGLTHADNMIRYATPTIAGFTIDGAASFGGIPGDSDKRSHYHLGTRYKNGPFEAAYNHIEGRLSTTASNQVTSRVDFFAAKYNFDTVTFSAGYVLTRNPSASGGVFNPDKADGKVDANTFFTGAVVRLSPTLSSSAAWYQVQDKTAQTVSNSHNDVRMFAAGLLWSPYKDWNFFLDYAKAIREDGATGGFTLFDKWKPDTASSSSSGYSESTKNQSGISIGAQYKF